MTAARALMTWIGPTPSAVHESTSRVHLVAEGLEELFVRWLQELLYEFQCRNLYTEKVTNIQMSSKRLSATLLGSVWDETSRRDFREVKAVTYHQLCVGKVGKSWKAKVILDV